MGNVTTSPLSRGVFGGPCRDHVGEPTHANSVATNGDDGASTQVVRNGVQVGEEQRSLPIRATWGAVPEQDDRGFVLLSERLQRPEVGVSSDNHPSVGEGCRNKGLVLGLRESQFSGVDRIMACRAKVRRQIGGQSLIDQEAHQLESKGSSRSRTAAAAKRSASRMSSASRSG